VPKIFNQAVPAAQTLPHDCSREGGLSEVDSQGKQEFSSKQIQGLEMCMYAHCYGD